MKFYRNTVVLIAVMCLLLVVCLFYYKGGKQNTSSEVDTNRLLSVNSEDIVKIDLNNKGGEYIFEKDSKGWKAVAPANFRFDMSRLNGILFAVSNLDILDVIDKKPSDYKQFGLDNPVSVSVKLKNNETLVFEVGNTTPFGDGCYIKKKDDPAIYKVDNGLCSEFLREGLDFRDRRLFDMAIEEFTAFTIKKDDKILIDIQKNNALYNVKAPVEGSSDLKGVESILSMMTYLCVNEYTEDDAKDLGKYGLDNPTYTITVKSDKINKTLLLGKVENDSIYARYEDSKDVLKFNLKDLYFVDNPIKEVNVYAYMELIENVDTLKIEMDNKVNDIKIVADKNDTKLNKYYLNGNLITGTDNNGNSLFLKFYQKIAYIPLAGTENNFQQNQKPDMTFTYTLKNEPKTVKIEFIPKDDLYYYVVKNGKYTGMTVPRSSFDDTEGIKDSYKILIK